MINANASNRSADTAIAFGQFLSSPSSQQRLLESGSHVTSNVTVDLAEYPNLASFREQAKVAELVVETSKFLVLEKLGDELYRTVLLEGADPEEAVSAFVEAVHAATGVQ